MTKENKNLGRAIIKPDEPVTVGTSGSWVITYSVGQKGIAIGGGIKIETPGILGWSRPQIENPEVGGYVTVSTSNREAEITPFIKQTAPGGKQCWTWRIIEAKVAKAPLKKGDYIKIILGDIHRGLGPGWKVTTKALKKDNKNNFLVWVNLTGKGNYSQLEKSPFIKVIPGKLEEIEVVVPSFINLGDSVKIGIIPKDLFHNPVRSYSSTLQFNFRKLDYKTVFLSEMVPPAKFGGSHKFSGFKLKKEGIYRVEVIDRKKSLESVSNPIKVSKDQKYKIYWGDLHIHSSLSSDNILCDRMEVTPRECYEIGRDVSHLDFMAITDHHVPNSNSRVDRKSWDLLGESSYSFYRPGGFVTFFGFEFSCDRGDTNIYFLKDNPKYANKSLNSIEKLWKYYDNTSIITIPHFHNPGRWKHSEWKMHPVIEPVVEIASIIGRYEYFNNPSPWMKPHKGRTVQDLLKRGYKVGVIAGSDDHKGQVGFQELVAVYARELTREAIFEALKERRCYGTTHPRIILDFAMDGHMMGEEYETESSPQVKVEVVGTDCIQKIDLIKDDLKIYTHLGKNATENFTCQDKKIKKGTSYYYIRVTQVDGEMAWSSPIFVNFL